MMTEPTFGNKINVSFKNNVKSGKQNFHAQIHVHF